MGKEYILSNYRYDYLLQLALVFIQFDSNSHFISLFAYSVSHDFLICSTTVVQ